MIQKTIRPLDPCSCFFLVKYRMSTQMSAIKGNPIDPNCVMKFDMHHSCHSSLVSVQRKAKDAWYPLKTLLETLVMIRYAWDTSGLFSMTESCSTIHQCSGCKVCHLERKYEAAARFEDLCISSFHRVNRNDCFWRWDIKQKALCRHVGQVASRKSCSATSTWYTRLDSTIPGKSYGSIWYIINSTKKVIPVSKPVTLTQILPANQSLQAHPNLHSANPRPSMSPAL